MDLAAVAEGRAVGRFGDGARERASDQVRPEDRPHPDRQHAEQRDAGLLLPDEGAGPDLDGRASGRGVHAFHPGADHLLRDPREGRLHHEVRGTPVQYSRDEAPGRDWLRQLSPQAPQLDHGRPVPRRESGHWLPVQATIDKAVQTEKQAGHWQASHCQSD